MDSAAKPIAIIQGAASPVIQQLLSEFVDRWSSAARLVGVVEHARSQNGSACGPGRLRSIADGRIYPLFQDLGPGAAGCSLDPEGAVLACEAVERDIAGGCDLVVLSKFAKMEADNRSGLMSAFIAAVEAGVPILSSVSPKFEKAWLKFAGPLSVSLPAEAAAIDDWWNAVRSVKAPQPTA
jgi:hypothetical protein